MGHISRGYGSRSRSLRIPTMESMRAGEREDLEITSTANARVKQLVTLRRRRARDAAGVTVAEGYAELALALSAGTVPHTVYLCPDLAYDPRGITQTLRDSGTEIVRVSRAVFGKVAYRESPDGWLAVVPAVRADLDALELGERPLVLVCEGVEKPGNLGAILRTADAAGATAVVAADPATDWGNPNVVRASKGTVFGVPVASASSGDVLTWIRRHQLTLIAAAPGASTTLSGVDLTGPVALAFGSESDGLSSAWLEQAEHAITIPMFGRADSLNVAASAAIVTYEAVRQRMVQGVLRSQG